MFNRTIGGRILAALTAALFMVVNVATACEPGRTIAPPVDHDPNPAAGDPKPPESQEPSKTYTLEAQTKAGDYLRAMTIRWTTNQSGQFGPSMVPAKVWQHRLSAPPNEMIILEATPFQIREGTPNVVTHCHIFGPGGGNPLRSNISFGTATCRVVLIVSPD
jgi:hypothetical protein